jgi:KDO2-lipid IV(A) lauroyltransferase
VTDRHEPATPRWHQRGLNNAVIVGATYYGVSYLPAWLTHGIGHIGTWIAYHLMREGRRGLLENLTVMFPDLSDRRRRALALATYRSYARDVIDFIRSLHLSAAQTRTLVARLDTAALDEAMAEGHGAIILSGHFGNWELGGVLMRRLTAFKLSVVAKAEPSENVTRLRERLRAKLDVKTIEIRRYLETALIIRSRLRNNEIVAMLMDRPLGKDYVDVYFFGRLTPFLKTPALLACLSGAPLVPCFVFRDGAGFSVECGPLIRVAGRGDDDASIRDATQVMATMIERRVRQHPEMWYQFYPYWSSGPVGHPSSELD